MSRRLWTGWAFLAVLGSLLGMSCNECPLDPPPDYVAFPCRLGQRVTVTVSPGLVPTFSWEPDCLIGRLIVEGGVGQEYWGTETVGMNIYRSPIVYGVHPPGSVEMQVPQPLDTMTVFRASLYRWTSSEPESLDAGGHLVGEIEFRPRPTRSDSMLTRQRPEWIQVGKANRSE